MIPIITEQDVIEKFEPNDYALFYLNRSDRSHHKRVVIMRYLGSSNGSYAFTNIYGLLISDGECYFDYANPEDDWYGFSNSDEFYMHRYDHYQRLDEDFIFDDSPYHLFAPSGRTRDPNYCCWKLNDEEVCLHILPEII